MSLNINNSRPNLIKPALLGLAFRPLFLFGTLFSVLAIAWWVHFWNEPSEWTPYGGTIWWHAHEMIFGFAVAIVTGFLLTAVRTWTGVAGLSGKLLAVFVVIWLLGRAVVAFNFALPPYLTATIDVAYLLFSVIAMAYPVIKVKQWRNLMFVPILLILTALNTYSHWAVLTNQVTLAIHAFHASIMMIILIIAILGGRVIPAFTANGTGQPKKNAVMWVEAMALLSILGLVIIAFIGFDNSNSLLTLAVSTTALITNLYRFSRWGIQHTRSIPLLWSLHLSFLFIPIGFALLGLNAAGHSVNISAALHSLTVGSIGGMILAMISRVTLGHTGRPLKAKPAISIAFVFILFSAIVRVIVPIALPQYYSNAILIAGILWVLAFTLFLIIYAPMLISHRADGKAG
jgi:uncharacterized protein involved in response to NO